MNIQPGNLVVYGKNGVCQIEAVVSRNFYQKPKTYYVLRPDSDPNEVIYVPTDNEAAVQNMRPLLSAEEIYSLIRSMPEEPVSWNQNEAQRKEEFRQILSSGDHKKLIQMIKALYQHQKKRQAMGKKLCASDERFFKEAENLLYDEFAAALHLGRGQVLPFIMEQLQPEQHA